MTGSPRQEGVRASAAREPRGVARVDRALSLLDAFDEATGPLSLSELARRAGLHKSTTLRLLESLRRFAYVTRTREDRYALGPAALRLGLACQRQTRLDERLLPTCERLVARGSESPSFFIRQGERERLCVFRLDSRHATLDRVRPGLLLPVDRGAAGHVFRAFGDAAKGAAHRRIRAAGHALSRGETSPDCAAVAAPVFDQHGGLAGVLSLSGPLSRFDDAAVAVQVDLLVEGAAELCLAFGGRPRP